MFEFLFFFLLLTHKQEGFPILIVFVAAQPQPPPLVSLVSEFRIRHAAEVGGKSSSEASEVGYQGLVPPDSLSDSDSSAANILQTSVETALQATVTLSNSLQVVLG